MGELIIIFKITKPTTIIKEYTKFLIVPDKCRSYLDINYPDLIVDEQLLNRCVKVFKMVLKSADGYDHTYNTHNTHHIVISREYNGWFFGHKSLKIFYGLFHYDPLLILCANPNDKNAKENEFDLKDILLDNDKYQIFLEYWSKGFDYIDLFNTIKIIALLVLKNSPLKHLPNEMIEMILCFAFEQHVFGSK